MPEILRNYCSSIPFLGDLLPFKTAENMINFSQVFDTSKGTVDFNEETIEISISNLSYRLKSIGSTEIIEEDCHRNSNEDNIIFREIKFKKNILVFKRPLKCHIKKLNSLYEIEIPNTEIVSIGKTRQEAIKSFEEDIYFLYSNYGKADDKNLTNGAQELKKIILEYVKGK